MVTTLLQILGNESLRRHIPIDIWAWLKQRPPLPPVCRERSLASQGSIVHHIREIGDIEILKSYLLLILSEWDPLWTDGFAEVEVLIREDFNGIGMWCHRGDLIKRLDDIQGQLDRGLEYFQQHKPEIDEGDLEVGKEQHVRLKNALLEVEQGAMKTLIRTSPGLTSSD